MKGRLVKKTERKTVLCFYREESFMSHHTVKEGYRKLTERLNRFPQGAPPAETLYRIMNVLMSETDAQLISLLPIKPFTAEKAAKLWKKPITETRDILDHLSDRALLLDVDDNGISRYVLPPPMAGFFEFSLMRITKKMDQKLLSELYYQYLI